MFKDVLKKLRKERGLSQETLADRLKVARSTVGMWETGEREPDYDTIINLAQYFNVTVDYLLGRTNKPDRVIVYDENGTEHGWASVVKDARASGLSPEEMKYLIELAKKNEKSLTS